MKKEWFCKRDIEFIVLRTILECDDYTSARKFASVFVDAIENEEEDAPYVEQTRLGDHSAV